MKMRRAAAVLATLTILTTACADATTPGDGDGTGEGGIGHPTGAGDVLLRISDEGGFVPVEYLLTALPSFTLYGDGTVVTQGAQTQIYPGEFGRHQPLTEITNGGQQLLRSFGKQCRQPVDQHQSAGSLLQIPVRLGDNLVLHHAIIAYPVIARPHRGGTAPRSPSPVPPRRRAAAATHAAAVAFRCSRCR